jgi:cytochrome c-type protein NapC
MVRASFDERICDDEATDEKGYATVALPRIGREIFAVFMLSTQVVIALVVGLAVVVLLFYGAPSLAGQTVGRIVLLVGLVALPLLLSAGNIASGFHKSSTTTFCLSCHEMRPYGKSLFVDSRQALSAVHYQNRLVDRETVCYSCHKDYAMFGDVTAKLNGLRHVWAHYIAGVPKKIELYKPYPNSNCLHCHDDMRRFVEGPAHRPILDALYTGKTSCLSCHRIAHDLAKVEAGDFWQAK